MQQIFKKKNLYLQNYAHVDQANTINKEQTQYKQIINKLGYILFGTFDRYRPHFRNSNDCFIKSF